MKCWIVVIICFWQISLRLFAQQEANGLLNYQEPAGSYAEAIEYHSAKKDNALHVLPELTVNGHRYSNVRLQEANAYTATISHANGVARLPLDDLSTGQVVSLNTTSRTTQLATRTSDLGEAAAPEPQGGTLTYRVGTAGAQTLGFIADKTGIPYWKVSVWLFFVILPVLLLALLVLVLLQSRRLRRLDLFPKIKPRL